MGLARRTRTWVSPDRSGPRSRASNGLGVPPRRIKGSGRQPAGAPQLQVTTSRTALPVSGPATTLPPPLTVVKRILVHITSAVHWSVEPRRLPANTESDYPIQLPRRRADMQQGSLAVSELCARDRSRG